MATQYDAGALIEGIYDAAMNPENWQNQLKQICDSLNCFAAVTYETNQRELLFLRSFEMPDESVAEYESYYLEKDSRIQFGLENPNLPVVHDAMHNTEAEKDRDEFCVWMRKYDHYSYISG